MLFPIHFIVGIIIYLLIFLFVGVTHENQKILLDVVNKYVYKTKLMTTNIIRLISKIKLTKKDNAYTQKWYYFHLFKLLMYAGSYYASTIGN